jgi:hypothetical protein
MPNARVFRCPRCQEFVATDAKSCRFCSAPIDARAAELAADAQEKENRRYMRRRYARHMLIGFGLFVAGVVVTALTLGAALASPGGGYFIITWGLILYGAGDFLYGLAGWSGVLR